jgi:putative heme degradation protein
LAAAQLIAATELMLNNPLECWIFPAIHREVAHVYDMEKTHARAPAAMTSLEQLARLVVDAVFNTDPAEFDAIGDAVDRFKTEDQASYSTLMNGGCPEFATLFGAIERAAVSPQN